MQDLLVLFGHSDHILISLKYGVLAVTLLYFNS